MSIIGDIAAIVTLSGKARELAAQTKNLELRKMLVDLEEKLIEFRAELVTLKGQNVELQEENVRLKDELKKASAPPEVTFKDGVYFAADGSGPYCPTCWENDKKLIHITPMDGRTARLVGFKYRCSLCKAHA